MKNVTKAIGAILVSTAMTAHAAVPLGVEASFTTLTTDFGTVLGYAYTAGAIIVGGGVVFGIVWKLLKRVGGKV